MKLIPVEILPKKRANRKGLQDFIEEFCNGEIKMARVDFSDNDYKDAKSCYSSIYKAIWRSKRPVKVIMRGNEVFLAKVPRKEDIFVWKRQPENVIGKPIVCVTEDGLSCHVEAKDNADDKTGMQNS